MTASAFSWSRLLTSPLTVHLSGTMLFASPPVTVPTFMVVSSPIQPGERAATAPAAALIAFTPVSGAKPACAAFPVIRASQPMRVGAASAALPTGPDRSRT